MGTADRTLPRLALGLWHMSTSGTQASIADTFSALTEAFVRADVLLPCSAVVIQCRLAVIIGASAWT